MHPDAWRILRILVAFGFGYFFSMAFRMANAIIAPDLVRELHLTPGDLGLLTSTYLIAFGSFQLPLGVLLDRYGPRRVESVLLAIAAAGVLIFGQAHSLTGLVLGRALIGLGVSSCLMAAFKAFVSHFPAQRLPLANGVQLAAGGLGALAATAPLQAALAASGWRAVFVILAALTLLAALLVWLMVPAERKTAEGLGWRDQWQGVRQVFSSRRFWCLAPLVTASQGTFMAVQGLWGGLWLRHVSGQSAESAAALLLASAAGMTAGYLLLGALSERLGRVGIRPGTISVTGQVAFMLVQLAMQLLPSQRGLYIIWTLFGALGTAGTIAYAELSQRFPAALAGRVNTGLNAVVFAGAFAAQWGIGIVVGHFAPLAEGQVPADAYRTAFAIVLALQVAALIWFVISRPRHAAQ